jgi:hypothetical protein
MKEEAMETSFVTQSWATNYMTGSQILLHEYKITTIKMRHVLLLVSLAIITMAVIL